jgi:polysaccharide biosynthesis/export protein
MKILAKFVEAPGRSSVSVSCDPFRTARAAAVFVMTMIISPAWAEYIVQQGDTIEIEVAGIPELKQRSTVQPDGAIAFPLVGALAVEGLTPSQLRSAVQTQLAKKIYRQRANDGREILMVIQPEEVSAAIVAYRPIYVTGDVVKPGEQTFLPKMTVRQALSLAGGTDINARFGRPTRDLSALKVDFELAWVDFASARARIVRVATELNGGSDLGKVDFTNGPLPKERLAEIETSENAIFQARMADYQREHDFLKSTIDQADARIAVVEKQQAEEEQGSRADTLELKRLVELVSKGQETNPRVTDARRALLLSSTRALQVNVELLELKRQKSDSARKAQHFEDDRRIALLKELEDTTSAKTIAQIKTQALESELRSGGRPASLGMEDDTPRTIEVVRQGTGNRSKFLVDEDYVLMPGDVINVMLQPPERSADADR